MKLIRALILACITMLCASLDAKLITQIHNHYLAGYDWDNENSFGVSLGYLFDDVHKLELELTINGFDTEKPGFEVDADMFTYMLNYQYYFKQIENWSFYAGAGLGIGDAEFFSAPGVRATDQVLTGQVGLGVDYNLSEDWLIGLGGRLQYFDDLKHNDFSLSGGTGGVIELSVGYQF